MRFFVIGALLLLIAALCITWYEGREINDPCHSLGGTWINDNCEF